MKTQKYRFLLLVIVGMAFSAQLIAQPKINVKEQFALAEKQYALMLKTHPDTDKTPQSVNPDGTLRDMPTEWWCSGFFGGSLWKLYEYTRKPEWKDAAHLWTMAVQKEQYNTGTHDLGFMVYIPFGTGFRLTKNPVYKKAMLNGAESLSTRFDPKRGVIKSWNDFRGHKYPVIIDNLMNLDFLFWATRETGNKKYHDIAVTHANSTIKNHFRPDNSSYHVLLYGPDGTVEGRKTAQGAADESAWARGQAWSLYGYTSIYRDTRDKKYLDQAIKIADFYINHPNLPADKVPYWDFNAPKIPNEERDASAAAITSSGLFELAGYVDASRKKQYTNAAIKMLESLSSPQYRAKLGENNNFLLKHSTGHKPGNSEIDVPLIYADYYYLEALMRYDGLRPRQ
ncbi:glycoside hydrolase family 88 protein [Daejeonella lutea]|uniref:Glycosyl Hydrolase Family 88 n=1 Tax=Daejeonella lutea TaxID=572036 RepID=A0A1T5ECJ5_9SPHI|nr:glycoside hydrolase family 88 protein [Daejeonella lutea]SKB81435.1 Glycosyl Hydrolase Family 88 [Daejeonella lutea]